jgi:uncharacterized protein (TIGR00375 family)
MDVIADLHLHSKYSRAVSQQMVIPEIARWARKKGLGLVGAADWTHPLWIRELRENLIEVSDGVYGWRADPAGPKFLLTTEIASIFSQEGKLRRIHTMVFAPNFSTAERINERLSGRGVNLLADGRPMTGLSVRELAEIVWSVSAEALIVPSHLWTPWFGTYGDKGGFNSLEEAYGSLAKEVFAIETGHSSDPAMNWRIAELDSRTILSFSDAHSPQKMSREATVFKIMKDKFDYKEVKEAIKNQEVAYTIEFYPEEGKYHYTGHRNCGVKHSPEETTKLGETCPVCGKPLTVGVLHRVEELASRKTEEVQPEDTQIGKAKGVKKEGRPPYVMLVPLMEILAEALGVGFSSQGVLDKYNQMVVKFGSELTILLETEVEEIQRFFGPRIAEGIKKVRERDIVVDPGFDGVFGTVKIWSSSAMVNEEGREEDQQMGLF